MRILFISRRFYPEVIGGGQISGLYIAKAVRDLNNKVFVCTFTDGTEEKKESIDGITIYRIPMPKLGLFPRLSNMDYMYVQIARLSSGIIEKVNPDIIHLLNFESVPISAVYFKKKYKVPVVATVNGPLFGCFTQTGVDYKGEPCLNCTTIKRLRNSVAKWGRLRGSLYYLYSFYYMRMLRFSYRYVDRFFTVSDAMKPLLRNMGVPEEKLVTIHNPIEVHRKVKTGLKRKLGIEGKKVILYAGRLAPEKGVQYTIQAMKYIDDAVFVVAGAKKGYYQELQKEANEAGVNEKVIFIGNINNEDLREYYSIADVVSFPCTIYESLSRMLLEASSYGVPVVATDAGGNREIIRDKINGIIIKDTSPETVSRAIQRILNDSRLRTRLSAGGQRVISEGFLPGSVSEKIVKEYERLVSGN